MHPCCVVIRPSLGSNGDFLRGYHKGCEDLHVGVTNSAGRIFEYDADGVHLGSRTWNQYLVVDLGLDDSSLTCDDPDWQEYWDLRLVEILNDDQNVWTEENYDETRNNCFTFVLTFLRNLRHGELSHLAEDKVAFCRKYILPKTTAAQRFICLYRKLKASPDGVLVIA